MERAKLAASSLKRSLLKMYLLTHAWKYIKRSTGMFIEPDDVSNRQW